MTNSNNGISAGKKSSSYGKKINFDNLEIASGNRKYPVVHSQIFCDVTQ